MKSCFLRLLTLMLACMMIIQVLPVLASAEEIAGEPPHEETNADPDDALPSEAADESVAEQAVDEVPEDGRNPDDVIMPEDEEPSEILPDEPMPDDAGALQEDQEPELQPVSDDQVETDDDPQPEAPDAIPTEDTVPSDDTSSVDASSEEPESVDVTPETAQDEETPDTVAVEDPDEIDYEALEAEYDMEFDDIYESFPEMTLEDEVDVLYNGSWIKYAIYNNGHAYVRVKKNTNVYSDSDLAEEGLICSISDQSAFLLATEHCQRWNTLSIHVWFMTPDNQMIDGYILEDDLVNQTWPDDEAISKASSSEHGEMTVNQQKLPVFVFDAAFLENENEVPAQEDAASVDETPDAESEDVEPESEIDPSSSIAPDLVLPEGTDLEASEDPQEEPATTNPPILRGNLLKMSSSATGLSDGQSLMVYRGDDLQKYVRAKDGSATTATYRHYVTVTVNGTAKNFDALCLNAKRSSNTNGFTASLINGKDYNPLGTTLTADQKAKADGMFWILLETNFSDPFDTAISQWAVWKYGGGDDYDSNVAKVSNIAAGRGFQYDTETMRARINALIDGARNFVANGGVPVTTITASASAVSRMANGHNQATVRLNSNGTRCRIAKSQLQQSTVTGYASEDNSYYYFQPTATFTIDFTADELNFSIDAWSRYDQYEYWVGDVSASTRQDMGFIVYTGGIGASTTLSLKGVRIYGNLKVLKRDADTGLPLPGVAFEILNASRQRIKTGTTDQSGVLLISQLEPGTYYVHETAAPDGYEVDDTYYSAEITENGQTVEIMVDNHRIIGTIKVHKVSAATKEPIAGVMFDVIDGTTGDTVAVIMTDSNGYAETLSLPMGSYFLHETSAPAEYAVIDTDFPVAITAGQRHPEIEIENEMQLGAIRVMKLDGNDNHPIAGVVFEIVDADQNVVEQITTDKNGQAVSGSLVMGVYTVREASTPEGYVPSDAQQQANVSPNKTEELTFVNTPIRFQIEIIKTDGQTHEPLAGAEFTIVRKSGLPSAAIGETVDVLTTDTDGKAVTDLLTWGEYEITETRVPEHYLDSGFSTTVTGTENGKVYTIHVENQPVAGQIRIVKTDALDGHPIEGVIFDIYQGDDLVGTMTTNGSGIAVSEQLPKGHYIVKERSHPEGYTQDLFEADCEVTSDKITELYATNQPLQLRIEIVKTDSVTHQPLPGAVFTVVRKSGLPSHGDEGVNQIVAVLVTGEDGKAVSELLTWGEYEIKETTVPDGYLDEGYTATAKIN